MSDPLIGHSALPTATDELLGIMAERDQAVKEREEALDALMDLWRTAVVFAPRFARSPADQQAINRASDLLVPSGRIPQSFKYKESEDPHQPQ